MAGDLTLARKSIWSALNAKAQLASAGAYEVMTKYTFDDAGAIMNEANPTSASECPAISIFPNSITPEEFLQQDKFFPYPCVVHFWTRSWVLSDAEQMWQHIINAIFQEKSDPSDAWGYIKTVTGFHPRVGPVTFQRVNLGKEGKGDKAIWGTFQCVLRIKYNPWQGT